MIPRSEMTYRTASRTILPWILERIPSKKDSDSME